MTLNQHRDLEERTDLEGRAVEHVDAREDSLTVDLRISVRASMGDPDVDRLVKAAIAAWEATPESARSEAPEALSSVGDT